MADITTALTFITLVMFPASMAQDSANGGKDYEITNKFIYEAKIKSKRIAQPKLQFYKALASSYGGIVHVCGSNSLQSLCNRKTIYFPLVI